jgi:16S rRNA processing protein RimM
VDDGAGPQPGLVEIGRIVKPHGLRGNAVVELTTDREERMAPGSELRADRGPESSTLVVREASRQRPAGDRTWARWVVRFDAIDHVDQIEEWRGAVLRAVPLTDEDELWTHDLVGSAVFVQGDTEPVGRCVAVVANPAADLLELDTGALVPVVFVVSTEDGRVVIDPPAGLLDL